MIRRSGISGLRNCLEALDQHEDDDHDRDDKADDGASKHAAMLTGRSVWPPSMRASLALSGVAA
jgi:hypothetical protein